MTELREVKAHWAPKFRELAKKDDRLELDELVLSGSKGWKTQQYESLHPCNKTCKRIRMRSWTMRLDGHKTTISARFIPLLVVNIAYRIHNPNLRSGSHHLPDTGT